MRALALSAVLVVVSIIGMPAMANEWQEKPSWNTHFSEHKAQGVFVLWNENKQQGFTNNLKRANKAFLPAST